MSETMNDQARHPMGVVVARTGVTPDVLRAWERRYEAVSPGRGAGGHRLYSDADVERLRLLRAVTEAGRRIGDVAGLPLAELERLAEEDRAARAAAPAAGTAASVASVRESAALERALELTRVMDSAGLEALLRRTLARLGVGAFMSELAVPLLHAVGDEWARGALTIAQEHMASALVQDVLIEVMRATGRGGERGRLLVATPSGERHGIGALLAAVTAAAAGWEVVDLGVDVPASEIAAAALKTAADVVGVSVLNTSDPAVLDQLLELRRLVPAETPIVVGGAGAARLEGQLARAGVRVARDLASFLV